MYCRVHKIKRLTYTRFVGSYSSRALSYFVVLVTVLMMGFLSVKVSAADYDVTATVPFDPPTIAAVFDPSLNGMTVNTNTTTVFGTCQFMAPTTIVSIWRTGSLIGSVNCEPSGTFSLSIPLNVGPNTLIAKSSSLSNNYGPDSSPIVINYTVASSPGTNTAPTPSTSAQTPTSSNPISQPASADSDLNITTPTPFVLLDDKKEASIQLVIKGGKGPYTVSINWGDGTTESSVVADLGTFSFKHAYETEGIYKVVASVMDVLGASKVYQFVVSATSLPGLPNLVTNSTNTTDDTLRLYMYSIGLIFLLVLILIVLTSFWLGRRYEYHELRDRLLERPKQQILKVRNRNSRNREL